MLLAFGQATWNSSPKENRRYPRAEANWPITVMTSDGPVDGETRNISIGGAFIYCEYPLPLRSRVCVLIKIPNRAPLAVNCVVARSAISAKDIVIKVPNGPAVVFDARAATRRTSPRPANDTLSHVALYFVELTGEERRLLYGEVVRRKRGYLHRRRTRKERS